MASTRVRIAIDAMGGDNAPAEIVAGALRAQEELGVDVLLVGDPQQIEASLKQHTQSSSLEIVPSEGTIEMSEEPLTALRRKPKASINVAMDLVKRKRADAVVSAGHSGAAMAAARPSLGRRRPAACPWCISPSAGHKTTARSRVPAQSRWWGTHPRSSHKKCTGAC